jgi:hypothetical protein
MTWRARSIAWLTCAAALVLPARLLILLLRYIHRREEESPGALRGMARVWNVVLLAFVFVVGLPLAKLALAFRRPPASGSLWVPRIPPEELARGIDDPF